jgi:hypothetical protein
LGEGGRAVPQVVQPYRRQPGFVRQAAEGSREPVRGHRVAVEAGEHVPAVVVAVAERGALGLLGCFVGAQRCDGGPVQGDGSLAAGGLRRAQHQAAVILLQLAGDDRGRAVQVDIGPAQPGGLAAP